jgi:predicted P-loop ATPase
MEPGCKVDTMLVLEGPQGLKKSSALRTLFGPEFFTDEVASVDSKDAAMQIQGVWCAELAEMHAMTKAEANRIKEWLSRQVDRYRPPYGRTVVNAPRRSVVVGTINPEGGYLRDPTGGRRFWPVECRGIDIDALRTDRDQLWAEAVAAYRAREQWWLEAEEADLARDEQEERYDPDAWEEIIARRLDEPSTLDEWSINDFFEMLGIPVERRDERARRRIGQVLTRLSMKKKRVGGRHARRFVYVKRPERQP